MYVETRRQMFDDKQDISIASKYFPYIKLVHYKEKTINFTVGQPGKISPKPRDQS